MGLDQVAYAKENGGGCVDGAQLDVATWRKHPNLQGYMESLWRSRGHKGEFNCVDVELSKQNILKLENIIIKGDLPKTVGFFYGNDADEYYKKDDLSFCITALNLIKKGYKIYYSSWW